MSMIGEYLEEQLDNNINQMVKMIQENIEWLQTTENDEVECIGIENLEGILTKFLNKQIKLSTNAN